MKIIENGHELLPTVFIEREALYRPEWLSLASCAKIFYFYIKAMYNGKNNGNLLVPYRISKGLVGCSDGHATLNAIKELLKKGWIETNPIPSFRKGTHVFTLTFKHENAR